MARFTDGVVGGAESINGAAGISLTRCSASAHTRRVAADANGSSATPNSRVVG